MAKFLPIAGNLSGSVGANTYSHNRGGSYVKRRGIPTNPNSARQQSVRGWLANLSSGWKSLTAPDKDAWASFALAHPKTDSLGNTVAVTGAQYYNALNSRLLDGGAAKVDTAPVVMAPTSLLTFSIVRTTATSATVAFTTTPLGAGLKIQLWMSMPTAGDRNPNLAQCRLVGYSAAAQATAWVVTIPHSWAVGQTVTFFALVMGVDGQVSGALKAKVTA